MLPLDLDVTSIPTFTNGGIVLLLIGLVVILGLVLLGRPPRWRCSTCATEFNDFSDLVEHEDAHCRMVER